MVHGPEALGITHRNAPPVVDGGLCWVALMVSCRSHLAIVRAYMLPAYHDWRGVHEGQQVALLQHCVGHV